MHYLDEGQGDPILCVHGNPTWSFYYRNIVNAFRDSHRVVVPDHLGCGLSGRPQNYTYTLQDHIDNLEALSLHLDLRNITLIVHDWGGPIGLGFALKHPERIKNIILLNTAAFLSRDIPKRIAALRASTDLLIRRANLFCIAASYMTTVKPLDPVLKRAYRSPYRTYRDRIAIAGFVKDIPLLPEDASYKTLESIEYGLKSLHRPTLILWGGRDFCFHKGFFRTWTQIYPHAQAHMFDSAGHYVLEDEVEGVVRHMREFLR